MKNKDLTPLRHTLAHLLASAVLDLYPDTKTAIGPAVDNGFYYDFEFSVPANEIDLAKIQKTMKKTFSSWKKFGHVEVSADEARKRFANNPYKLELIDEILAKGEKITLYTAGDFTDLCRGGHLESPAKEIDPDGFKLDRVAGAYWRGSEKNKMLTRIYGLAFASGAELDAYVTMQEEAKKRDHKKLGKELDLFTFSDLVGAGLPLWTPKGTILRDVLDNFVWELRQAYGYQRVDIPHIAKKDLYEKSGHWEKFSDELFKITTREKHLFVMKPMNCPHHIQIFARKPWSYRELPARYASSTKVYRDEQSGELGGLARVRGFTQDDAHVFCRPSQVRDEAEKIWNIIMTFYGAFGFELHPRLSLHDPAHMDKYLGTEEMWLKAESDLRELIKEKGKTAHEAVGEAAFYGPKIDFMAKDSIGREWQVATIQLDVNLPDRFELDYTTEKGTPERVVMLHAAIMGSIERFLSVLIEHYAGAFPLWLAPVQVKVLSVGEAHHKFAEEIFNELRKNGFRPELDNGDEGLGKKVRAAKVEKVPYWLVIGDKEVAANKVTLESRDSGNLGQVSVSEVIQKFVTEIAEKK